MTPPPGRTPHPPPAGSAVTPPARPRRPDGVRHHAGRRRPEPELTLPDARHAAVVEHPLTKSNDEPSRLRGVQSIEYRAVEFHGRHVEPTF